MHMCYAYTLLRCLHTLSVYAYNVCMHSYSCMGLCYAHSLHLHVLLLLCCGVLVWGAGVGSWDPNVEVNRVVCTPLLYIARARGLGVCLH